MTGVAATLPTQMIAALVAAALYVSTYFSFVYLLRYPRNWYIPSLMSMLVTGTLAAITVLFVSLSADGFAIASLVIATGFLAALFYIMAAPAIAFQPAPSHVEFLAKHGDYAGLWLLGPALAAGLAVPNIRLQAVLIVAMIIEMSWFLRLRWADRRRPLYPIQNTDLAVLEKQASGDLDTFRRRHRIRELVLTESNVAWRGCTKTTPPCAVNLYTNRLGLNTAPCCREHMKDLCRYIAESLGGMGVVHWLEGGTLLGAVRENGQLIAWDDDIDISVLLDGEMTWDKLAAGLVKRGAEAGYYVDTFKNMGCLSISFDAPKPWPFRWERNRLRGEIRADIAIYRKAISFGQAVLKRQSHKGALPATEGGGFGMPQDIILPTSRIRFVGGDFSCPNQPDKYLQILYGDFRQIDYTYVDKKAANSRASIDDH